MIPITRKVAIPDTEIETTAVRASGPGGQNVNKVASAIHLRFDIAASSLPEAWKQRLLQLDDSRITQDGVVVIKARTHRTRERNLAEAEARLQELVRRVARPPKKRIPTRPTRGARERRLKEKARRSETKAMRQKPEP